MNTVTYYVVTSDGIHINGYIDAGDTSSGTPVEIPVELELYFLNNIIRFKLDGKGGVVEMEDEEFYELYPNLRPSTDRELIDEYIAARNAMKKAEEDLKNAIFRLEERANQH